MLHSMHPINVVQHVQKLACNTLIVPDSHPILLEPYGLDRHAGKAHDVGKHQPAMNVRLP